jgi:hypothetical protein
LAHGKLTAFPYSREPAFVSKINMCASADGPKPTFPHIRYLVVVGVKADVA